jgi:hypothetical protein
MSCNFTLIFINFIYFFYEFVLYFKHQWQIIMHLILNNLIVYENVANARLQIVINNLFTE